MKKSLFSLAAAAGILLTGCTSIESTRRFNGVACGTPTEKAVCQTLVQMPGYYFLGLPIAVGDTKNGGTRFFVWNQTTDNVVWMLTKEAQSLGATRMINIQLSCTESFVPFPFVSKRTLSASGTGVRSRSAAVRNAGTNYDREP